MHSTNQITATLSATDKTNIINKLRQVEGLLPFLIALTNEERKKGFKLGDGTLGFAQKSNRYAIENTGLIPSFVDLNEWNKLTKLATDLHDLLQVMEPLMQNIHDTFQEVGIEAMNSSHAFYNSAKLAAHNNVPGAQVIFDDLKTQFHRASKIVATPNV